MSSIENICKNTLISRSRLQKLFQELHGCGVMEFFTLMKIDTAKELIRSNQMNFRPSGIYLHPLFFPAV